MYLPKNATIEEACEWLQHQTGDRWTLPRLLEEAHLVPYFWLDSTPETAQIFEGRPEGQLMRMVFASDLNRLSAQPDCALAQIYMTPAGHMVKAEPPLPVALDELRFKREDVQDAAAALVRETTPAPEMKAPEKPQVNYRLQMVKPLAPNAARQWRGGLLSEIQLYTLEDAARLASRHAAQEITARDFLTAAGDGLIALHAFVKRQARMKTTRPGDSLLGNSHGLPLGTVPAGAGLVLPLSARRALANAGRASWRAVESFEERPEFGGEGCWFDCWVLEDDEKDFETELSDCRVSGYDIRALADAFFPPEPEQPQAATPAPVVAGSASNAPAMNPPPVATGDIAHAFDGLRGWNEKAWKDTLGSPPKWLEACIALRGERGKREHHWNPVFIGAALVHKAHARANNIRARFQTRPQLSAWLEAWKTYEADNFDTQ